ncbi:hypothetical protein MTO96_033290 [Rhipicephalus appendiculatus]
MIDAQLKEKVSASLKNCTVSEAEEAAVALAVAEGNRSGQSLVIITDSQDACRGYTNGRTLMLSCLLQLTVEALLRFATTMNDVIYRLNRTKQIIGEMCGQPMDFCAIDNYLRGTHAKYSVITGYLSDVHGSPGPVIVWSSATKLIFCAEDEHVTLSDECTLEKALLLCLTVYYIKDVTYPPAFAQTLGLIQSVLHKEESFPRCWASSKLLKILRKLKDNA